MTAPRGLHHRVEAVLALVESGGERNRVFAERTGEAGAASSTEPVSTSVPRFIALSSRAWFRQMWLRSP